VAGPGIWILLRSRRERSKRTSGLPDENATPEADLQSLDKAVTICAWAALTYLALSSIAAGVSLSVAAKSWYPTPAPWAAYAAAWAALVLPLVVLVFAIQALARPHALDAKSAHTSSSQGKHLPSTQTERARQSPS